MEAHQPVVATSCPESLKGIEFGACHAVCSEACPLRAGQPSPGTSGESTGDSGLPGGDFYHVFQVKNGKVAVFIGDACGHGVKAASTAIQAKDIVYGLTRQLGRPGAVLRTASKLLIEQHASGFVTLFLAVLDPQTGQMRYSSAGHPNALLQNKRVGIQILEAGSPPLGVFPDQSYKEYEIWLEKDDLLLLYTDGAIEARRDGEFFGQDRLTEALKAWTWPSPELLPEVILADVLSFSGGVFADDVAILALGRSEEVNQGHTGKGSRQRKRRMAGQNRVGTIAAC